MNRFRIFSIIFFSIFFITGCEVQYNIEINDGKVKETAIIVEKDSKKWNAKAYNGSNIRYKEDLEDRLEWPTPAFYNTTNNLYEPVKFEGVEYYEKTKISTSNELGMKGEYTFNLYDYRLSSVVHRCYDEFEVIYNENSVSIYTGGNFKCFGYYILLDKVNISLKTEYKVLNHNADSIDNGIYKWTITKNNAKNKPIVLELSNELDDGVVEVPEEVPSRVKDFVMIFIIWGVMAIILVMGFTFVYNKNAKANKV